MFTKNQQLAERMWKELRPIFKNTKDLSVHFDNYGVKVSGLESIADEIFSLIDKAEAKEAFKWDMRTIHYLEKLAQKDGGIEIIHHTSDELDEMKDWSEYYEFNV